MSVLDELLDATEQEPEQQEFNNGHIVEGLDRTFTLVTMVEELLSQHPAVLKAGAQEMVEQIIGRLVGVYHKLGELEDEPAEISDAVLDAALSSYRLDQDPVVSMREALQAAFAEVNKGSACNG